MSTPVFLEEPSRIDEPRDALAYSEMLSRVASEGRPIIVRRDGADVAAVVPLEQLQLLREALASEDIERIAAQIDWGRAVNVQRPPQTWFDDDDNPFEPDEDAKL
jgi:antitoxin (DNA-binding transcriptional repressor) of toxin-antitoxin stability system